MSEVELPDVVAAPVARYIRKQRIDATLADYTATPVATGHPKAKAWHVTGPGLDGWAIYTTKSYYRQATIYHRRGPDHVVTCDADVPRVVAELLKPAPRGGGGSGGNPDQNRLW